MKISSEKECRGTCWRIALIIAIIELIYLFVHLFWLAFTQINPFDWVDGDLRNTSLVTALEFTIVPQSEFTEQLALYFDFLELFFCALLLLALFKRVKWLSYPYLIKSAIYSAIGLFVAIMAIISLIILKEKDGVTKIKEKTTTIYMSIFGSLIFFYNIIVIVIVAVSFRKTRVRLHKHAVASEFYLDE